MSCPAPAIGSEIWRCTGTPAACMLASRNWRELGVIAGAEGEYQDSTAVVGSYYTYAGICTDGSRIAPPSNFYTTKE